MYNKTYLNMKSKQQKLNILKLSQNELENIIANKLLLRSNIQKKQESMDESKKLKDLLS